MEQHLAEHGVLAERLRATTPADLPDELLVRAADRLSPGELACTASYLAAWRLVRARSLPHALVLEDDCVLAPRGLRRNLDHLGRALGAFERADIVSARHRRIPFAGDVLA